MADPTSAVAGVDEVTDVAAELEAATSQLESQLGEEPQAQEPVANAQEGETSDPYADADAATLKAELKAREDKLAEAEKKYAELQSLESRHYNEQREELVKMRERVAAAEALASRAPAVDPVAAQRAQDEFDREWAERLAPGDPEKGKAYVDFLRGTQMELREEIKAELAGLRNGVQGQVREVNPVYQENKELIDKLVSKGMSPDDAMVAASVVGASRKKKAVSQPGQPQAPGSVATATRTTSQAKPSRPLDLAYDPFNMQVFKMAGLSQEEIDAIAKEAGRTE